jgi:hypothetical protein
MKTPEWDEYRVSLFKKKIRALLPQMQGIRFERSKGRSHLILPIKWRYYTHANEVFEYVLTNLKANGIEAEAKSMFRHFSGPDYITIPIDQAALPERMRR